jgi:intracellular multiplication protein IcmB
MKSVIYALNEMFGKYNSSRLPIMSQVDSKTLQLQAGLGYMSALRMYGAYGMFGRAERSEALQTLFTLLSSQLQQPGCQIQWVTEVNPDQARDDLRQLTNVSRETWRRLNVDMAVVEALIGSREEMLASKAVRENNIATITTSMQSLGDPKQIALDSQGADRLLGGLPRSLSAYTQMTATKMQTLYQRHHSNFDSFAMAMRSRAVTQICETMESAALMRDIRRLYLPDSTAANWQPAVQGDRKHFHVNSIADDHTRLPHLRDQILSEPLTVFDDGVVRIGNRAGRYFAVAYMYVHPLTWLDSDQLINAMPRDFHWWTSMCFLSGATKWRNYVGTHKGIAQSVKILSNRNGDIASHAEMLIQIAKTENLCGFRMQVCTQAKTQEQARHQIYTLISQLQAWGGSQWRQDTDDPDEMLKHAVPGCDRATTFAGSTFAVPVKDAMITLPFTRPGSIWQRHMQGSLLMLTEAKRLYPFKHQAAGVQKFVSDVLIAPMGGGKSVLLQAIRAAYIEAYAADGLLPRMVTLDIGPSSSGIILLLQSILPKSQVWQAEYKRVTDSDDCCMNPFDTQLCVWQPTTVERMFLSSFLTELFTSAGQKTPPEGVSMVVPMIIEGAYKMFLSEHGNRIKMYTRGLQGYSQIDAIVDSERWNADGTLSWKGLTIKLFQRREYLLAEMAQWRAMPTIPDLADVLSSNQEINDFYGKQKVPGLDMPLVSYLKAVLQSWTRLRIFSGPTTFRTNARVLALNLEDVVKGGGVSGEQQGALIMLLARHATTRKWWVNDEVLAEMVCAPDVRDYHRRVMDKEKSMPSRLDIDEYHRTKPFPVVREQFARDRREIRKFNIHYGMASQSDDDFGDDDIELASSIFFLGAPAEQGINRCRERFGLPPSAVDALRSKVRGADSEGAHILMIAETAKGRLIQYLTYPLPSFYLWAFSSTPNDVTVRKRCASQLGYLSALKQLVRMFPGGSIEKRVDELKTMRPDLPQDGLLQMIVDEVVEGSKRV